MYTWAELCIAGAHARAALEALERSGAAADFGAYVTDLEEFADFMQVLVEDAELSEQMLREMDYAPEEETGDNNE